MEATAEWLEFGNAHNIVADEETEHVFVVGAVPTIQGIPGITCAGCDTFNLIIEVYVQSIGRL